jgi:hypothetical protein
VHLHQHLLARLEVRRSVAAVPLQPAQRDEAVDGLFGDVAGAAARQGVDGGEQRIVQRGVDLGEGGGVFMVVPSGLKRTIAAPLSRTVVAGSVPV